MFFVFFPLLAGCVGREYSSSLLKVEDIIQTHPEQAYKELIELDKERWTKEQDKALYSLLLSLAMDKNYIDICSDSIITTAVSYYSRTNEHYRKFLSYYCLGRVQENAEEYEKAMSAYIKAGEVKGNYIPLDYHIRLHTRKGTVYYHQFALDKALADYLEAQELARQHDNPAFYISCTLDVAATRESLGNHEAALAELDSLQEWLSQKGIAPSTRFHNLRLRLLLNHPEGRKEAIESAFQDYSSWCKETGAEIDNILAADYYLNNGKYQKAAEAINRIDPQSLTDSFSKIQYYTTLSSVRSATGNFKEALDANQIYLSLLDKANVEIYNNDVRFLEERTSVELKQMRSRYRVTLMAILLIVAIIAITLTSVQYIRKRNLLRSELEIARAEYGFLRELSEEHKQYPERFRQTISTCLQAFKPYLLSKGQSLSKINSNLVGLNKERHNMLSAIGIVYSSAYPRFVSDLSSRGLTADEIGLCCMYISGYSAKELDNRITPNKQYHDNSSIRTKLGLSPNGEKLSSWLRELFEELNGK